MRFLLGLALGALLALLLAGRLDGRSTAALEARWQSLLREVGTRLFPSPAATPASSPDEIPGSGAGGRASAPAEQTLPALAAPRREPELMPGTAPPMQNEPATLEALLAFPLGPAATAPEAGAEPPSPEAQDSGATAGGGRSPVWVPFHSERSARGFARHLSEHLEHPFDVRRQGPGRYQVQFQWQDPAERDALLAAMVDSTALSPGAGAELAREAGP